MNNNFKYLLPALTALLSLGACADQQLTSTRTSRPSASDSSSLSVDHSYAEVSDMTILWSEIFSQTNDYYLVYIFASWCNHCNSIKNNIIDYALSRDDFYFVNEASSDVVFGDNVWSTIGLTSTEGLMIVGYPTLLEISSHTLTSNISSPRQIVDFIM